MDPHTGKIYDLNDPTIPPDVRERLVPLDVEPKTTDDSIFDQEVEGLKKQVALYEALTELPDAEVFRPVPNRAEKRAAARRKKAR